MKPVLQSVLLAIASFSALSGCATVSDSPSGVPSAAVKKTGLIVPLGGARFLVLGFGLISVEAGGGPVAAQVVRGQVLGLQVSSQPGLAVVVGYAEGQTVVVPAEAADVRLEASRQNGVLKVTVDRAQLKTPSSP